MKFVQNAAGAILGPMDSWLILRGTKTLAVRMERTNENAQALAEYLDGTPEGASGALSGPARHIRITSWRRSRCAASAGADPFDVGSLDAAYDVCNRVRLMALAESLGGVETLISHPAS